MHLWYKFTQTLSTNLYQVDEYNINRLLSDNKTI